MCSICYYTFEPVETSRIVETQQSLWAAPLFAIISNTFYIQTNWVTCVFVYLWLFSLIWISQIETLNVTRQPAGEATARQALVTSTRNRTLCYLVYKKSVCNTNQSRIIHIPFTEGELFKVWSQMCRREGVKCVGLKKFFHDLLLIFKQLEENVKSESIKIINDWGWYDLWLKCCTFWEFSIVNLQRVENYISLSWFLFVKKFGLSSQMLHIDIPNILQNAYNTKQQVKYFWINYFSNIIDSKVTLWSLEPDLFTRTLNTLCNSCT